MREVGVDVKRRCSAREAVEGGRSWAEESAIGVRDLVFAPYVYVAPLSWRGDSRVRLGYARAGVEKLRGVRVRL